MDDETKAKVLKEFIADNWQRFINHCDHHGISEEKADIIYEQLDAGSH